MFIIHITLFTLPDALYVTVIRIYIVLVFVFAFHVDAAKSIIDAMQFFSSFKVSCLLFSVMLSYLIFSLFYY